MKGSFIAFVFLFFTLSSFGQNEDVIGGFTATEFNGKVLLSWAVKQGNTCNGIQILRSTDSVNFSPIGSINGICGSTQGDTPYEFTDIAPIKNAINYYRLNMGGIGFSVIVSAEVIDIAENNYLLRPNPIETNSELHFQNDASNTVVVSIYDLNGNLHSRIETIEEMILLSSDSFEAGPYFFVVEDLVRNTQVRGRFVVP
jgi:hypothetical protein